MTRPVDDGANGTAVEPEASRTIDVVMAILSADDWLADFAWGQDRNQIEHEWEGDRLVPTHVLCYADRRAWEADRSNRRYRAPFHRSDFRMLGSKTAPAAEGRRAQPFRVVSTPHSAIDARIFERDGTISRIEFHALDIPYAAGRSRMMHVVDQPGASSGM